MQIPPGCAQDFAFTVTKGDPQAGDSDSQACLGHVSIFFLTMLAGTGHQGLDELSHPLLSHCTPGPYSPRNYLFRRSLAQRNLHSSPSSLRQPHCGMSSFSVAVSVFVHKQTWSPGPGGLCHGPASQGRAHGTQKGAPRATRQQREE